MPRDYNINISICFPHPLRIVVKLESDTTEAKHLAEELQKAMAGAGTGTAGVKSEVSQP